MVPLCSECHGKVHGFDPRVNHSELVKAALLKRKREGKSIGGKKTDTDEELIETLYREGQNVSEISREINLNEWVVRRILLQRGLKKCKVRVEVDLDKIKQLYEDGKSAKDISSLMGYSASMVKRRLWEIYATRD